MSETPRALLEWGLRQLGLALDERRVDALLEYLALLQKWNRAFNLTAVREPREMVVKHLLDSLAVTPWFDGGHVLDIGSGAGLPGIPLAIAQPDRRFDLLDSNGKKTRFMHEAARRLGLGNVAVIHSRIEDLRAPEGGYDIVTARAFASLGEIVALAAPLLHPGGKILALKGRPHADELSAVPDGHATRVEAIEVPGLDAERHLIIIGMP